MQSANQHLLDQRTTLKHIESLFPIHISPHFLALMQTSGDPLARQVIPDIREARDLDTNPDPLNEESQAPVPQVVHRYPHRVIFLVSNQCALHCRFCMRKRRVTTEAGVGPEAIETGIDYIRRHKEINEVIFSGGDPFMLPEAELMDILTALHAVPHIRLFRIHTRVPCAWPQRITSSLVKGLSRFHPLYVNIHFNHPDEISPQAQKACSLLADAGIPLGSQTVLLRNINDDAHTLHNLFQTLLQIRVRPYYLHQLDRAPGTQHFQVPIDEALKIVNALRGRTSGIAMPHFMVDLPGGGGKVEFTPESVVKKTSSHWLIRNFQGEIYRYPII